MVAANVSIPKLLSPHALHSLLQYQDSSKARVIPLDVSLVYPPASEYTQHLDGRIPGAKFFSMKRYAAEDPELKTTIMLPTAGKFVGAMRYLGIRRDDHIVCYDVMGFWTPARGAWMLKVFGHEKVSVLNGGLPAWKAAGYSIETGSYPAAEPSDYPFVLRNKEMIASFDSVASSAINGSKPRVIIDTRPVEEYADIGHVSNSFSLPFTNFLAGPPPNDMRVLPEERWKGIITKVVGDDLFKQMEDKGNELQVISTCGWGVTACTLWIILGSFGVNTTVYDESWEGYEMRAGNPVEKGSPDNLHPGTPTKGVTSFPELQIAIDALPDDGTPKVDEVSQ
ncbi:hypothetical protein E1B28_013475 [Marasmius oreades]|uniref:Rhodanese domain-containing protein n=1 Tax=Marasmius oreades TaxID=181124 RepID=A0A9P7UPX8_9AGAR|nr:uncharacterized protein E1B28_013475 [Marasmius oreades]KAG7087514.1 hypothetical protein E1B28_013475 [Marasmius oreades]